MHLPSAFTHRMQSLLVAEEYRLLEEAVLLEPTNSIRLNRQKCTFQIENQDQVPWSASGFYLKERLSYTFDPLFHAGIYYVQEASSMFLEQVLKQYASHAPVRYLDLCAAPGGKSTLAASVLPQGSLLISNELIRNRAQVLAENMVKWGTPYSVVTNNAAADFAKLTHYFDIIQADVPCSGEGMFRKDPNAITEWSTENVALCAHRQRQIVRDVWDALRPGGLFIYSTCTYNTEENEENIRFMQQEFGAELLPVATSPGWNIQGGLQGVNPVYRFMPHRTRGEGLFMALLRKPEVTVCERESVLISLKKQVIKRSLKQKKRQPVNRFPDELKQWIQTPTDYSFIANNETFYIYPKLYEEEIEVIENQLNTLHKGVCLGVLKGREIAPHPELGMSTVLNHSAFPAVDISWQQAVSYLRHEAITLSATERGYLLLTYLNYPLGWVKNIGNRANNLYPAEWRIRSGYLPERFQGIESIMQSTEK